MNKWLVKLRGILGLGTVWSIAGAGVGLIGGLIANALGNFSMWEVFQIALPAGAGLGFALGTAFASVLAMLSGRKTIDQLTAKRAAAFGALAGAFAILIVHMVIGDLDLTQRDGLLKLLVSLAGYGGVSAAVAAGTLALAKRATAELQPGEPNRGALPGPKP